MKVVLFCGGQGLRLRDYAETVPKPMVPIGPRPVLWHVMRYYAHFGYKDFVLCLGYKAEVIKEYFLATTRRCRTISSCPTAVARSSCMRTDIQDWRITFVDTGLQASVGERLMAVRRQLDDEELFLANYADVLTDARMDELVEDFLARGGRGVPVGAAALHVPRRRKRGDGHVAWIRNVANLTSGSTAGTSSCDRRSSTTCSPARSWWSDRSNG